MKFPKKVNEALAFAIKSELCDLLPYIEAFISYLKLDVLTCPSFLQMNDFDIDNIRIVRFFDVVDYLRKTGERPWMALPPVRSFSSDDYEQNKDFFAVLDPFVKTFDPSCIRIDFLRFSNLYFPPPLDCPEC